VAGLPYSETSSAVSFVCANPGLFKSVSADVAAMRMEQSHPAEERATPIMVVHSRNDCVVRILGSENIRDTWIRHLDAGPDAIATSDCTREGVACERKVYGTSRRSIVETVFYDGKRGEALGRGSHYCDGDNPFSENPPPTVTIASATVSGNSLTVSGIATAASGSIAQVSVRLEGRFSQSPKLASGADPWTVTFTNLTNDAFYVPVAKASDNDGVTSSVTGEPVTT
jgi:hypothetical protein